MHEDQSTLLTKEIIETIPGLYERGKGLMRYCWNTEVLPEGFVRGLTLMFYKGQGKDKEDPGSYRPVTCLLHFYKWFSTLVLHRLAGEVELFHTDTQAGFRPGRCTEDMILMVKLWQEMAAAQGRELLRGPSPSRDCNWFNALEVQTHTTSDWVTPTIEGAPLDLNSDPGGGDSGPGGGDSGPGGGDSKRQRTAEHGRGNGHGHTIFYLAGPILSLHQEVDPGLILLITLNTRYRI
jgi:hypothetical protein